MSRRSRTVTLVLMLALAAGGAAVAWLRRGGSAPTLAPEANRTFFVSNIVFSTATQSMASARRRAEAAYDLIQKGTAFEEVAGAQSDDENSKLCGGFVGPVEVFMAGGMDAFQGAVQMLAEGQLSRPVFLERGWLLLKRHPYEEGRALERRWRIPCFGFRIASQGPSGGEGRTREEAAVIARLVVKDLRAGVTTLADAKARYGVPDEGPPNAWKDMVPLNPQQKELFDRLARVPEEGYPDPLESKEGWIVLKRGTFFRSVVRHILVQHAQSENHDPKVTRSRAEAAARAEQALAAALAKPDSWEHLVRTYSDELFSVEDEGTIGCLAPGSLPPSMQPVEAAILATAPGRIHPKVVESAFGFHVVWRVD